MALTSSESSKLSGTLSLSLLSLVASLFLSPHLSHLTGTSGPIFACRHRCAPISAAPPDFSPPRSHRPPP
uniref:Uncharacterized protein n=1 Tax=Fagus sylvatica TaxID=28930 RepID=A0A2N9GGV2_FAGSY